ncbi:hypothetical protein BVX99_03335 [bacterium F16]|nr:hypothetical protein BVX99_03335 [bacterium F16]
MSYEGIDHDDSPKSKTAVGTSPSMFDYAGGDIAFQNPGGSFKTYLICDATQEEVFSFKWDYDLTWDKKTTPWTYTTTINIDFPKGP